MAQRSTHPDMFHAAPPPPSPLHHPPPYRHPYPTTPVSDAHASPYHPPSSSYQPRQFPTTPQTPNYASTSRSTDYPPTPQTPHHHSTPQSQHHGQPHTPVQSHHTQQPREYYPSPSYQQHQPHAGPSRLHPPPTHPHAHYQQRFDNAGPTQPAYRSSHDQYPSYPHSAPPRVMQNWSDQAQQPSPTGHKSGAMTEQDVCSQFLNLHNDGNGDDQLPPGSTVLNTRAGTMKLVHWTPEEGRQAQEVTIILEVEGIPDPYDEQATRTAQRAFRGMFGKLPCSTRVTVSNTPGQSSTSRMVTLYIVAPPLHMTGCTDRSNRVSIYVQSLRAHDIEESLHIGDYTYLAPSHARVHSLPPTAEQLSQPFNTGTKRSGEPLEQDVNRPWSASEPHQRENHQFDYGSMSSVDPNTFQFNYPPHPEPPKHEMGNGGWDENSMTAPPAKHARPQQNRASHSRDPPPRATPLAPSVMQPPAPMMIQPPPAGQPSLIRSTQIAGGASWYDRLRAEIVFQNDLLSMMRAWTPEEWNAKRRLVKVWRRQVDSQIFMAFRAITPEEYPESESAVVVSCIFREDKNACYITSVDIIYLLEAVIGQRFSIEEKNRIRRNLEGFRPQTVSKNKPGSEDFFRTVMAFPEPKPRNIEKDLKVFQWDCLPQAVKKIISKYTAQYHPSGEPLVPQGVTDAHHEIRAPHPDYHPAPPAPLMHAHHQYTADENSWSHPQPQSEMNRFDPSLTGGYSASRQNHLQVDTAAANAYAGPNGSVTGNSYYPAAYSPTPQMTHSSSSNVVPSEFVVSPVATAAVPVDHPSNPASAPLPHPSGGYLQQQQATAPPPPPPPPPYSDVQSQAYWTNSTAAYSMSGAGAYDEGGMYANLVSKPLDDEHVHLGQPHEVDLDVRNIYTSTSA